MTAAKSDTSLQTTLCIAVRPLAASVRPERVEDLAFCAELFALTRAAELMQTGWPDEAKRAFCQQQFDAQHAFYRQAYPDAEFFVIEQEGRPIGRVYIDSAKSEERLMEITLVQSARGHGIGTAVTAAIVSRAHARRVAASLYVEPTNPARRLYERQGFLAGEVQGYYMAMRCEPRVAA